MTLTTTLIIPNQQVLGIVTASVNCLRRQQFQFDQDILDELTELLTTKAKQLGGDAVIGISFQLLSPTLRGYVQYQMTAIGTAVKKGESS